MQARVKASDERRARKNGKEAGLARRDLAPATWEECRCAA